MLALLEILLWALALIAAATYVLGPILIRHSLRLNPQPNVDPVALEWFPPDAQRYIDESERQLLALGFTPVAHLRLTNFVPNATAYLALAINRATGDRATVSVLHGEGVGPRVQSAYAEFSTRFADRSTLSTMNSSQLGSLKPVPEKRLFHLPQVQDLALLYRVHQQLLQEHAPGAEKVLPAEGEEVAELRETLARDPARQVEVGFLYYDLPAGVYRPTWTGAFLMTWGLCWPVSAVRKALVRRRGETILKRVAGADLPARAEE